MAETWGDYRRGDGPSTTKALLAGDIAEGLVIKLICCDKLKTGAELGWEGSTFVTAYQRKYPAARLHRSPQGTLNELPALGKEYTNRQKVS